MHLREVEEPRVTDIPDGRRVRAARRDGGN